MPRYPPESEVAPSEMESRRNDFGRYFTNWAGVKTTAVGRAYPAPGVVAGDTARKTARTTQARGGRDTFSRRPCQRSGRPWRRTARGSTSAATPGNFSREGGGIPILPPCPQLCIARLPCLLPQQHRRKGLGFRGTPLLRAHQPQGRGGILVAAARTHDTPFEPTIGGAAAQQACPWVDENVLP